MKKAKAAITGLAILAVLFVVIQLVPVHLTNPR